MQTGLMTCMVLLSVTLTALGRALWDSVAV